MSDEAKCFECGTAVSYETGFTMTGGLGDSSEDRIYCPQHAPNKGNGYTLSDLQRMREEGHAERAKYEMSQMDLVGPDVYFAVKPQRCPDCGLMDMGRHFCPSRNLP